MPQDESNDRIRDLTAAQDANGGDQEAQRALGDGGDDVTTPGVVLPLGTTPLIGASFGAAGAFSPATSGSAPLAGGALPLVAPLLAADTTTAERTEADGPSAPAAGAPADDGALAERVEAALAEDGRIAHSQTITVAAGGGVVELGGTAGSEHDRALAEAIAARLPGVAAVRNLVRVASGGGTG